MQLDKLTKVVTKKSKRVGRGNGSGKGKTSARGQKGQNSRGSVRVDFEGGQLRLIKRLPFRRGIGNDLAKKTVAIKVSELKDFKADEAINNQTLLKAGLISKMSDRAKIIGGGEFNAPLKIEVPTTKSVKILVEKAGGQVS